LIESHAIGRYQPGSARKIGIIADLIRGRAVPDALKIMIFLQKPTKAPVMKALRSAVSNAIVKAGKAKLKEEDLIVTEVWVGQGSPQKRWTPGPRGMATPILRRTCHVYVKVASKKGVKV
jgi:large subunit ribosomal protein L22